MALAWLPAGDPFHCLCPLRRTICSVMDSEMTDTEIQPQQSCIPAEETYAHDTHNSGEFLSNWLWSRPWVKISISKTVRPAGSTERRQSSHYFTDEATEAQRGEESCPRSHSEVAVEKGAACQPSDSQSNALDSSSCHDYWWHHRKPWNRGLGSTEHAQKPADRFTEEPYLLCLK